MSTEQIRPRFSTGAAVVSTPDGYLIDGAPRRQRLRGAATGLFEAVLPLLDGHRSVPDIAVASGLDERHVGELVTFLDGMGLLEMLQGDATSAVPQPVSEYLSRTVESLAGYRSGDEAVSAMAGMAVLLVGPRAVTSPIRDDLVGAGVGWTGFGDSDDEFPAGDQRPFVIAVGDVDPRRLDAWFTGGVPVLRAYWGGGRMEVGPVFAAGVACPDCVALDHADLFGRVPDAGDGEPADRDTFAALVVCQAVNQILNLNNRGPASLAVYAEPDLDRSVYHATPRPNCARCLSLADPDDTFATIAAAYEDEVEVVPLPLRPRRSDASTLVQYVESLMVTRPAFPTAPRHPLPDRSSVSLPTGSALLDREQALTGILQLTGGFRGEPNASTSRWAASGGNQASAELYLVSEHPLFGAPAAAVLRYDDVAHAMVQIRKDQVDLPRLLVDAGLPDGPLAVVMIVGGVKRLSGKYGAFAFRLAHLDAGCTSAQLTAVAGGYGLAVRHAVTWSPRLGRDILELIDGHEVLTAVIGVYERQDHDVAG
jgi:hypothetical protein